MFINISRYLKLVKRFWKFYHVNLVLVLIFDVNGVIIISLLK